MLSNEQKMVQQVARNFAQETLWPNAAEWDRLAQFPKLAINAMAELGFMGMLVPAEWGGSELDYLSYVLAMEEIAAGDGSCSTIMSVNNSIVCVPILEFGTEEQKENFLKPLASGEMLGAFCLTEPNAGSDASAIQTTATLTQAGYILNGEKQFITSGASADIALIIAVTDTQAGKKGFSAFIVPTNTPGYMVGRIEKKLGQRATDTAQIVLQDCLVPRTCLLGEEGQGYKIALSNLEGGRLGIAAQAIGMARSALEQAKQYSLERKTFGKALKDHQAIAFRLADMATQLTAARALLHYAVQLKVQAEPCIQESSMAKLFATEMAENVCTQAIQIHGGYGYLQDYPVERIYRDVRVASIYEGTSDVQRMVISKQLFV